MKMARWLENGAKLAWLIDPYDKVVHEYKQALRPLATTAL
jgi:Uma2 family endonuclease